MRDVALPDYKLNGEWYPMHLDMHDTITGNYKTKNANKSFINLISQPIHRYRDFGFKVNRWAEMYYKLSYMVTK
jgi:hypothetical protein